MSSNEDGDSGDEPFHPLGEEWQDELEATLEDTEYDTDLGLEMAEDAMKVTKGELSEEAFHDRYHEDVLAEFGEDERPIESGEGGRFDEALSRVGVGEESRRDVMKKMGAGAGAVGLGAWGTAESGGEPSLAATQEDEEGGEAGGHGEGTQWGMTLDLERCDGCLACVTACAEEHNWDQGANWMYILDFEDSTPGGRNRLIRPCQHCTDAPCEKVCPTTARHTRDSDGLVLTDYDVCIGCRYCQVACPYGVNYFQWDEPDVPASEIDEEHMIDERGRWVSSRSPRGTMQKCTFCATRQDGTKGEEMVGTTACEDACPPQAINFGDMNDPESVPQQYLENVGRSRAAEMVQGQSPNRDEIEEAYAFVEGDVDLLEMSFVPGEWDQEQIEAVQYVDGEVEASELQYVIDAEEEDDPEAAADEASREIVRGIVEDPVTEAVGEDGADDEVEAVVDALVGEGSESDADSDALSAAEDQLDAVLDDSEAAIEDAVDRYESREITPAEVEEALAILEDGEANPVSDAGITDEEQAEQVIEAYTDGRNSSFRLLEDIGTHPNIVYIGNEPGPEAEQVEGPVAYDDVGQTDDRKEVLDDGTVDFGSLT
ncbi:4Fe-4S ferredoxin N-terminal domain-containing protein [Halosolutus amylolyticus]|uniref:4Fe-4S ferredoxin N-terminal domain-containing protein n=1 Tax=Halosolutus amylolyticus TaxID=2932267 RepID=A0ABD5PP93_9EURY|nr:4Fe-4S ferredoxin N-terminal domain-containing protein [Halosolutus amylolyticus]